MSKFISVIIYLVIFTTGIVLGSLAQKTDNTYKKYKMNLKCVQGELYEEIRTNMYIKSHLECFEQRTLTP